VDADLAVFRCLNERYARSNACRDSGIYRPPLDSRWENREILGGSVRFWIRSFGASNFYEIKIFLRYVIARAEENCVIFKTNSR